MDPHISFNNVLIVGAVAFTVPLLLGLMPRLRLPAVVLEIVAGIIIGPAVLNWVEIDLPIQVFALVGLAFVLFLAGLEIDFRQLRGRLLRLAGLGFVVSFGLAVLVGYGLKGVGLIQSPLFVAITLAATALGILIPLLKDSGLLASAFGQMVVAAASIADFGTVIILSLFFSREATSPLAQLSLIGGLVLLAVVIGLALLGVEHEGWLSAVLSRLEDTTAQIRVRGAFVLMAIFVALAEGLGLEAILGAFIAGAILNLVDRDQMMTHPQFRHKLAGIGFGVFIPFFFITSGLRFNLSALFADVSALVMVPIFLLALLVVRGLPALLYRNFFGSSNQMMAAGLLQATSLSFIVVATQIGTELGQLSEATAAALVAAGLLSVLIFPVAALTMMRRSEPAPAPELANSAQPG
jgi:Kef-type K+ transport system membrane component KefB